MATKSFFPCQPPKHTTFVRSLTSLLLSLTVVGKKFSQKKKEKEKEKNFLPVLLAFLRGGIKVIFICFLFRCDALTRVKSPSGMVQLSFQNELEYFSILAAYFLHFFRNSFIAPKWYTRKNY